MIGITSVSRVGEDWSCARKRYWGYEHDGTGITKNTTNLPLALGSALHEGAAALAEGEVINKVVGTSVDIFRDGLFELDEPVINEQASLLEGMLRGLNRYALPNLLREYPIVAGVEMPMEMVYKDVAFVGVIDLLLKAPDGRQVVVDYKTTSSNRPQWLDSWEFSPQVHFYGELVRRVTGDPVAGVIIQGLYKGYNQRGKQYSPFCYGHCQKAAPPFAGEHWAYQKTQGYRHAPLWTAENMTLEKWIDEMPIEQLATQFPQTPLIFPDEQIAKIFMDQAVSRETVLRDWRNGTSDDLSLGTVFPQNLNACSPSFGSKCRYLDICRLGAAPEDVGFEPKEQTDREIAIRRISTRKEVKNG